MHLHLSLLILSRFKWNLFYIAAFISVNMLLRYLNQKFEVWVRSAHHVWKWRQLFFFFLHIKNQRFWVWVRCVDRSGSDFRVLTYVRCFFVTNNCEIYYITSIVMLLISENSFQRLKQKIHTYKTLTIFKNLMNLIDSINVMYIYWIFKNMLANVCDGDRKCLQFRILCSWIWYFLWIILFWYVYDCFLYEFGVYYVGIKIMY